MSWFHHTKQEQFVHQRKLRLKLAERARNLAIRGEVFVIPKVIRQALASAEDDDYTYGEFFHERLPAHLNDALQLEILMWKQLALSLEKVDRSMDERSFKFYCVRVRNFTAPLIDLLRAECEMVNSCVAKPYAELVKKISAHARTVAL